MVASVNSPTWEMPALFTRQSIFGKTFRDSVIILSTNKGLLISPQKDRQDTEWHMTGYEVIVDELEKTNEKGFLFLMNQVFQGDGIHG